MVLRKPYGFLIKHFRLIHLVLTSILLYIGNRYRNIYIYLGKCISDAVNRYDASLYIDYRVFIFIFISLILMGIIYWLLKYKDKPRNIYIFSILGYVINTIILLITFGYLSGFSANVLDQKTVRLYRDIIFICNLFQYYIIIVMLIRGLGFDIKKFNFGKDVQELNLSQEDNEEVEVNVGLNTTDIVREVRKKKREFGYFFKEFKGYIITIMVISLGIISYKSYSYFNNKYKVYNQGEYIGSNIYVKFISSYYTINDEANYVIVKFNSYKNGNSEKINIGNMVLSINDKKYAVDKNICYNFKSIGNCYKQQYINDIEEEYILVYKVSDLNIDNTYIFYSDVNDKTYKVKLNLENIKSD